MGPIDFDFIKRNTSEKDKKLFLGPIDENQDTVEFDLDDKLRVAHFMAQAGIFPSVGQARKNGWDKPIPLGFSHFIVGKKKSKITILNIEE
jgi:hypothetical protein